MIDATQIRSRVEALFERAAPTGASALQAVAEGALESLPAATRQFAEAAGFKGAAGQQLAAPGDAEGSTRLLVGVGSADPAQGLIDAAGRLATAAPEGRLFTPAAPLSAQQAAGVALNWALGAYDFAAFKSRGQQPARLNLPQETLGEDAFEEVLATATGVYLARDLVNTPTSHLGPASLQDSVAALAHAHGASLSAIVGEDLLTERLPMIHAVGRAGVEAPRLLDLRWSGADGGPVVTIVGKGVCFDTGGLNLKPSRAMRLMKKDMGGAAAALGLAAIVMALRLPISLRVLLPVVENSVSAASFRPGDVLHSRAGLTVEIGDTDAEGRLILADALALADEEETDLLIDLATLTGAARVALGPDIAPFYTPDDALASEIAKASDAAREPLWRMPLYGGYRGDLSSPIADLCNISSGGFAGSITAALFLERFVRSTTRWAHFDIYAWNPKTKPARPEGGEATAVRALAALLKARYTS